MTVEALPALTAPDQGCSSLRDGMKHGRCRLISPGTSVDSAVNRLCKADPLAHKSMHLDRGKTAENLPPSSNSLVWRRDGGFRSMHAGQVIHPVQAYPLHSSSSRHCQLSEQGERPAESVILEPVPKKFYAGSPPAHFKHHQSSRLSKLPPLQRSRRVRLA